MTAVGIKPPSLEVLGIKQGDTALFFPAPNALVPLMFAKFMNKRKVTFVDTNEISVSTLIKLAAQMKLSNTTVKLTSPQGKFPVPDNMFDLSFSDWGLSSFSSRSAKSNDAEVISRESCAWSDLAERSRRLKRMEFQ